MKRNTKSLIIVLIILISLGIASCCILVDEAVLVRKGTIFHADGAKKVVALTFDDGPSPIWTPKILSELRKAGIKATFFMVGEHVAKYPDIAQQVAKEGHEIGNHTYDHHACFIIKWMNLKKR